MPYFTQSSESVSATLNIGVIYKLSSIKMLNQNNYDIAVVVKEVEIRGEIQPRVFLECKCGASNLNYDDKFGDPFVDYLKQVTVTPDPENYPYRTKLIKYKVVLCKRCKSEIPHGVVGAEVGRQIEILKSKNE